MSKILESALPKEDRVRRVSGSKAVANIDSEMEQRIASLSQQDNSAISIRIAELSREWDVERFLAMNASSLALSGVVLSAIFGRGWLILPGTVLTFLLQHALQGWCPPLPLFRRFGVRTRQEIELERYALKALRGDFKGLVERDDADEVTTGLLTKARE